VTIRSRAVRTLLIAALSAGCQTHAATCRSDAAIAAARTAWQARHVDDYRFVWQQTCFCLPDAVQPIVVTVRHGAIVSATDRSGVAVSEDVRKSVMTIDALYRYVDDAQCKTGDVRLTASKDGVPDTIHIDPSPSIADDEFDVRVSEFAAIPH
jgi:hypothetical protein